MSFHPGQRVVCINASPTFGRWERRWFGLTRRFALTRTDLVKGRVYTIAGVFRGIDQGTDEEILVVQIVELPPLPRQPTGAYAARRFRPLSEQRLEQFRAHLAPVGKRQVSA